MYKVKRFCNKGYQNGGGWNPEDVFRKRPFKLQSKSKVNGMSYSAAGAEAKAGKLQWAKSKVDGRIHEIKR